MNDNIFPKLTGHYTVWVNGLLVDTIKNTWTNEGATYLLGALDSGRFAQEANMYVALYSGAVTPSVNWTAADFPSVASEITSSDPGYSGNRPLWVPDAAANNEIDSANNPARFSLVSSAGTITVQGLAILSRDLRGGTQGVLISAVNFNSPLTLPDGTNFDVGWKGTLTP